MGSNYVSLIYTDRIVELGGTPSVGSKGDSYDNAVADEYSLPWAPPVARVEPMEANIP